MKQEYEKQDELKRFFANNVHILPLKIILPFADYEPPRESLTYVFGPKMTFDKIRIMASKELSYNFDRSAMRAVAALLTIPGADKHPQLNEFVTQVLQSNYSMSLFSNQLFLVTL